MKVFDSFRTLLRAKSPGVSDLQVAVVRAEEAVAEGEARLSKLNGLSRGLLTAGDPERNAHRGAITEAMEALADARLYLDELRQRLADIEIVNSEASRRARYDAAKALADEATKVLVKEYPSLATRFLVLLQQVAEAERAIQETNADLPVGATPLLGPEAAVRDELGLERKVIRQRIVERWCDADLGRILPDELQTKVRAHGAFGSITHESNSGSGRRTRSDRVERRRFSEVVYLPATQREWGPRLSEMSFPALHVHEAPFWSEGSGGRDPQSVTRRIQLLADRRPSGSSKREALTELTPLNEAPGATAPPLEEDA